MISDNAAPVAGQKITPFLWFDHEAEEATAFYVSVFERSRILNTSHYGEDGPGPAGGVMTVSFELDGQRFTALNGGPGFPHTQAVSFFVECETQAEIDRFWDAFSDGGEPLRCGWINDRFGVTWQIVPAMLFDVLGGEDEHKSQSAMQAMMGMKKLNIAELQAAYDRG
jgi:predicted 3-demethylubiquinone-9 3-methyltransferase (glyoxalase superfamily)